MSPKTAGVATAEPALVGALGQTLMLLVRPSVDAQNVFVVLRALSRPVRRRGPGVVDSRSSRRRPDAVLALIPFSARPRDQLELAGDACRGIVETAEPAHVLLWTVSGRIP